MTMNLIIVPKMKISNKVAGKKKNTNNLQMHCIDTAKTGLEFKIVYQLELVGKFVVMLKNISIK